jgi:excisionase family DNA binding protein
MRQILPLSAELLAEITQAVRTEVGAAIREVLEPIMARMLVSRSDHFKCAGSESEFCSVRQARDRLAVSNSTLYRMAKRGEITLLKRGRSTLIARAEVDALVARLKRQVACERSPPPPRPPNMGEPGDEQIFGRPLRLMRRKRRHPP